LSIGTTRQRTVTCTVALHKCTIAFVPIWSWVQHHRWLSILFLAFLVVGSAGGTAWAVFFRTVASPVSLREALRLYHRENASRALGGFKAVLSPGVFSYETSGGESLNLLGVSRSFPSRTSMVVAAASNACSAVDWVPIAQHTETTSICAAAHHSLVMKTLVTHEAISGTTTTAMISCPSTMYLVPPIDMPGVQWTATCHEDTPANTVSVSGRVLGTGPLTVGGQIVPTLHVRLMLAFSGTDQGTNPIDFWVSTSRGLIVREQEAVHIAQGGVHYTETMDSRLVSVTPAAG